MLSTCISYPEHAYELLKAIYSKLYILLLRQFYRYLPGIGTSINGIMEESLEAFMNNSEMPSYYSEKMLKSLLIAPKSMLFRLLAIQSNAHTLLDNKSLEPLIDILRQIPAPITRKGSK